MALSTLGTDPDYASLLGQRQDPRLLMAQKLMELDKPPATNASQSSFWANLLNQGARGALGGYLYGGVEADREKLKKEQETEAGVAGTQLQDIMKRLGGADAPVKDGSGGTAPAQPAAGGDLGAGSSDAGATIQDRLRQRESSGNYGVMNKQRYAGGYQFGSDLMAANNLYQPTEQGEPANTWGGTFTIPGHPNVKTLADFRNTPEAQDTAYRIAMANNDKQLREMGVYDRAAKLGVTRDGLLAGAWLGGVHGVANWVDSGGQSNPGDANGTRIGDYVRMGSGQGGAPTTAARAPAMARGGQQADAGSGSNLEALLAGVDAAKPRGIQLAERMPLDTATDAPTPILPNMAPVSTATAPLPFLTPPAQPDAATAPPIAAAVPPRRDPITIPPPEAVPDATLPGGPAVPISTATTPLPLLTRNAPPPPPEPAPPPAMLAEKLVPVPGVPAGVPPAPSNMPTFDDPLGLATAQPPPLPPLPPTGSGPEAGPTDPNAPLPLTTPPSQAPMVAPPGSGETGGQPTIPPPPPTPMVAPAGSGETGGQPTVLPQDGGASRPDLPIPVPPIPPQAGPSGPQLAAALQSPGELAFLQAARAYQPPSGGPVDLFTQAGIASPYAAPSPAGAASGPGGPGLVTPTGDTTTATTTGPGAGGGPGKGAAPAPAQLPGGLPDQATVTEALTLAAQWKASSNPRVREKGMVLETAATMGQRRLDHFQTLQEQQNQRQFLHDEGVQTRADAARTALANRPPFEKEVYDPAKNEWRYHRYNYDTKQMEDTGQIAKPGKSNAPEYPTEKVVGSVVNNVETLKQIDDAIAAAKANPNAFGIRNWVPGADRFGTPQEQAARAKLATIANREIHTLSGSAVGVAEDKRMQGQLPYVDQNQQQVLTKLQVMREMATEQLKNAYNVYGSSAGYRAIPGHARALGFEEDALPADAARGGIGSGTGAPQAPTAPPAITPDRGNAALATARRELGAGASEAAILKRAREIASGY